MPDIASRPPDQSKSRLREIAREIYIKRNGVPSCDKCGKIPADVHHKNGDIRDNARKNQEALCRGCHVAYHNEVGDGERYKRHVIYEQALAIMAKGGPRRAAKG